jgi:hypothetical protein
MLIRLHHFSRSMSLLSTDHLQNIFTCGKIEQIVFTFPRLISHIAVKITRRFWIMRTTP